MFKWFQDKIRNKRSFPVSQQVEIASEAGCDGTINHQTELSSEEGNRPADLARGTKEDSVDDSLKLLRKSQGDVAEGILDVECAQKCSATHLHNVSHSTCSSSTTNVKEIPIGTHTDCHQQHLPCSVHIQQCTTSFQGLEKHMEKPSSEQTIGSYPGPTDHRNDSSAQQTHIGNAVIQQEGLKSNNVILPRQTTSSLQLYDGESSSSHEDTNIFFNSQKHKNGSLLAPATQKDEKNTYIVQHSTGSDHLTRAESSVTIDKHADCIRTLHSSPHIVQEHKDNTIAVQYHVKNTSSPPEQGERTIPHEHNDSTQHIGCMKSTFSSHGGKSSSTPQNHTENVSNLQEGSQSTDGTQKLRECIFTTQEPTQKIQKSKKYKCCSSSLGIIDNTDFMSPAGEKTRDGFFLASANSLATGKAQSDSTTTSKVSIVGHEQQNNFKDRNENQEQETNYLGTTENNIIPEENITWVSDLSVNKDDFSCLQEEYVFEKVKQYSSDDHLSCKAKNEREVYERLKASVQVCEPLLDGNLEKDLICNDETVLSKSYEKESSVIKVDKCTQTKRAKETFGSECHDLCCLHQACLYNQRGRKCTVFGEPYIVTYLKNSPVLVKTMMENSGTSLLGCMVAWISGKAIELRKLEDDTEVYFDAVVTPKTSSFITLVIWLDTKPSHTIEPYCSCYVIVEQVRNCPLKFVSFAKENGLVSAHINGQAVNVMFSKSVVYCDGKNTNKAKEIRNLSNPTPRHLYGDIVKLMTLDGTGKVVYGFTCSCMWLGCKPPNPPIVYDPLKLYKNAVGSFVAASKQSLLLCDKDALLETTDANYKIIFENEGQLIQLTCDKKKIFSGSHRVQHPVDGKVKVHLRKQIAKGVCTWIILMVQMQSPPMPEQLMAVASGTQPEHNKGPQAQDSLFQAASTQASAILVASENPSPLLTASPDGRELYQVASRIDEEDLVFRSQHTAKEASFSGFDSNSGNITSEEVWEAAVSFSDSTPVSRENSSNDLRCLNQSFCPPEVSRRSTARKVTHVPRIWTVENPESHVQGDHCKYFHNLSCQSNQHVSIEVVLNCRGVLKCVGEKFILQASLKGNTIHIEMGKVPWISFDNGKGKRCKAPMSDVAVRFDAHFVDYPSAGPVGHILALWNGKKSLKVSIEDTTYYYDAPGVYHGTNEKGYHQFIVMLEGNLKFITTQSTAVIFEANGKHCTSLPTLSHVFLHLRLSHSLWAVLLVVLQLKQKSTDLIKQKSTDLIKKESSFAGPKSSSLPNVSAEKNSSQTSQQQTKTSDTHEICQAARVELTHYMRNLYGTLAEVSGERVIITHCKNIQLSVEIPENCNVDGNSVGKSIQNTPIGTKLHFDAFCKRLKSLRYKAVLIWLGKKPRKSVSHLGLTFFYNVPGRCLNSSEEEVNFEFFFEGKSKLIACKRGYIIKQDGSYLALRYLKVGTTIQANLMQQNEDLSINQFVYVTTHAAQQAMPSVLSERKLEEEKKPPDGAKHETKKQISRSVTPLNDLPESPKNTEADLEVCEHLPSYLEESRMSTETELGAPSSHTNSLMRISKSADCAKVKQSSLIDGEEGSGLTATGKVKVTASNINVMTKAFEYVILKGIISQPHQDTFTFIDERGNLTININPLEIAVDLPSGSRSPTGEFYLMYHWKAKVGVCGWYQHMSKEVYLQLNMKVYAHNPESKVLTLELPEKTSLYNFLFDNEVIVKGNKVQRQEKLRLGLIVHPVIEDINPCLIDGCVISHRIAFVTTIKGIASTCLNFLKHSLLDNREEENYVRLSLPSKSSSILSYEDGSEKVGSHVGGATLSSANTIGSDALPKPQLCLKGNNDAENCSSTSAGISRVFKAHSCNEISTHCQSVQLSTQNFSGNIPSVDTERGILKKLVCSRYPRVISKTHMIQYVVLYGKVCPKSSDTHVFTSRSHSSPIELPANLPHLDVSTSSSIGKYLMLVRKICPKDGGVIEHQPVVMWPLGKKCEPYILVIDKVFWRPGFLQVTDATDGSEKWLLCEYDSVFSLKSTCKISEVIESFSKEGKAVVLYALVENMSSVQIQGQYVQGNILLLTTSKGIAMTSVDIFIGSYYEDSIIQTPNSPICQLLHLHRIRMERAMMCKRGVTCYYPWRERTFFSGTKLIGVHLEAHTDDFAIFRNNKRNTTAACHLSNIYYRGLRITSLEVIPKHLRVNFWTILLPLDDTVKESTWEVNAMALVAWCCHGPQVLATHQCYYHDMTLFVPQIGCEEKQQAVHTNKVHSKENYPIPSRTLTRTVMSLPELECWQCQAGSTIFSFHETILQCSDLIMLSAKVTLVNEVIVVFMSPENELVKCKLCDVFIMGKQCQSVSEITNEIDKTYNIFVRRCHANTHSEKTVALKGVIALTGSLKSIGIHICKKHSCILNSSFLREEIAIAEEVFQDIALLCEQSSQCSAYHLSKITIPCETLNSLPKTLNSESLKFLTMCHGVVVGVDESGIQAEIMVILQQGSDILTLPVPHSRLIGLHKSLPIQQIIGHSLKVMLDPMEANYGEKSRILMAWGSFSQEHIMSPNSMSEPEEFDTQITKSLCCPRALVVEEFQSLFNTDLFELKSFYEFRNVDESGRGFFHKSMDNKLITCKVEYIMGWPKVNIVKEELWNLLVLKAAQIEQDCPEAVAAWKSETDSLSVGLCDIHGVKGINILCKSQDKIESKYPLLTCTNRGRKNKEPHCTDLPHGYKLKQFCRSRHTSESQSFVSPSGFIVKPSAIVLEDGHTLSKSLPSRLESEFASEYDVRQRECNQDVEHSSGSSNLLSVDEVLTTKEGQSISQCHSTQLLCNSSASGDNFENSIDIESKEDITWKSTLTTIKSRLFMCTMNDHGLLIDRTSHITALLNEVNLYINKVRPKESLKQIFRENTHKTIHAIVVPLVTPLIFGDHKVTHEAVVAWLGLRPAGIDSMLKNASATNSQARTLLHDKTDVKASIPNDEGNFKVSVISRQMNGVGKPHEGSLWAARPTLRVIYAKQETVSGCTVEHWADYCGILKSILGPILFHRQLLNVEHQQEAKSGMSEFRQIKLEALVLELAQSVKVLDFEVKMVAVMVWSKYLPAVDESSIAKNLEIYRMNWIVVIIYDLLAVNKKPHHKKSTYHSFHEVASLSDPVTSHCSDFVYYCSHEVTVRQYQVISVLLEHVLFKHQESLVMALKDDVKCNMDSIVIGKYFQVTAVRVVKPFNFCSHLITHFALLAYSEGMEPPEVLSVISDWSRGKIEKVITVARKLDNELEKAKIHMKIDVPADVKTVSLGTLWPLTEDRPEGDMIFAAEGTVCKLVTNCGIMKITGLTLNDNEIKMFFTKDVVLINDKHLSGNDSLELQMVPALKQAWRCTGQRLCYQERQIVMEKTGEEAQYGAFVVWCEVCLSAQYTNNDKEKKEETKMALNTAVTPRASLQCSAVNAITLPMAEQLLDGQVEAVERGKSNLSEGSTSTTTGLQPQALHSSLTNEDPWNHSNQQLKSTNMGRVTEVYRTIAQVALENEDLQYVARDRCFVYGVCLEKVELWHVLSIGLPIEYELMEGGEELKGIWIGNRCSLDPSLLLHILQQWCLTNNVTPSATNFLLMEAGWLPTELAPTVAPEEDMEVVEVVVPKSGNLRP